MINSSAGCRAALGDARALIPPANHGGDDLPVLSGQTAQTDKAKPRALPFREEEIPVELTQERRWMLWRHDVIGHDKDGRPKYGKVPYRANGRKAKSNDPSTWSTFDECAGTLLLGVELVRSGVKVQMDFDGLGFALGDGFHGVDVDDCYDPETGQLSSLGQEALDGIAGYAERSPSGTGFKIFTRLEAPGNRTDHIRGVERYTENRYFTVTGHRIGKGKGLPPVPQNDHFLFPAGRNGAGDSVPLDGDAALQAFAALRPALEGWDADRIREELLAHLDPDMHHNEWIKVGQALHHQFSGGADGLDLWDEWSSGGDKYAESECAKRWASFKFARAQGSVTLATLLHMVAQVRPQAIQAPSAVTGRLPLALLTIDELKSRPPIEWTVKGIIPRTGLGVLFGGSGSGKTFTAIDLGLAAVRGVSWCERKVRRCGVVYVAAEGAGGLGDRTKAYEKHHGCDLSTEPFYAITAGVSLLHGDAVRIVEACQAASAKGVPVGLVMLDTLNRTMGGGDENSSVDMTKYVTAAANIAELTGAFVMIVHHTGKDASRGARGHSSLRAAVDVELEMTVDGDVRVLRVSKCRDGRDGDEFAFAFPVVELGVDEDLDKITSRVVVPTSIDQAASRRPKPQGKWQEAICSELDFLERRATVSQLLKSIGQRPEQDLPARWEESVRAAAGKLVQRGVLRQEGDVLCLA